MLLIPKNTYCLLHGPDFILLYFTEKRKNYPTLWQASDLLSTYNWVQDTSKVYWLDFTFHNIHMTSCIIEQRNYVTPARGVQHLGLHLQLALTADHESRRHYKCWGSDPALTECFQFLVSQRVLSGPFLIESNNNWPVWWAINILNLFFFFF